MRQPNFAGVDQVLHVLHSFVVCRNKLAVSKAAMVGCGCACKISYDKQANKLPRYEAFKWSINITVQSEVTCSIPTRARCFQWPQNISWPPNKTRTSCPARQPYDQQLRRVSIELLVHLTSLSWSRSLDQQARCLAGCTTGRGMPGLRLQLWRSPVVQCFSTP